MAYEALPVNDTNIILTNYDLSIVRGLITNVAQSGKVSTKRTGVQRFDFKLSVQIYGQQNIKSFQAFLNRHIDTPFWISLPAYQVNHTTNATCSSTTAAMATTIPVSGFGGTIPAGAYLQFTNHSKVYQLLNTITGSASAQIYPPLRSSITTGELINLKDVRFLVKQTEGTIQSKIDTVDWIAEYEIDVKEAF